jgi:hypothetical protein
MPLGVVALERTRARRDGGMDTDDTRNRMTWSATLAAASESFIMPARSERDAPAPAFDLGATASRLRGSE